MRESIDDALWPGPISIGQWHLAALIPRDIHEHARDVARSFAGTLVKRFEDVSEAIKDQLVESDPREPHLDLHALSSRLLKIVGRVVVEFKRMRASASAGSAMPFWRGRRR